MKRFYLVFCILIAQQLPASAEALPDVSQGDSFESMSHARLESQQGVVKRLDHLVKVLQVSAEQKAAFLDIMMSRHEARVQLKQQFKQSRGEEREMMKALHGDTLNELQDVLTDTQLVAFKELMRHKKASKMKFRHRQLK
jgi:hypothetical protein